MNFYWRIKDGQCFKKRDVVFAAALFASSIFAAQSVHKKTDKLVTTKTKIEKKQKSKMGSACPLVKKCNKDKKGEKSCKQEKICKHKVKKMKMGTEKANKK